jgi:molybdate transport system substrate-binding protein
MAASFKRSIIRAVVISLCAVIPCLSASAAEIRVLSSSNMQPILTEITGLFERATGHKLSITIAEAVPVRDRVLNGDSPDIVITQRELLDDLWVAKRLTAGIVDVARSTVSVVVREGMPKPNISSVEALKASLLSAKSIAYPDPKAGGLAGIYFTRALEHLGIADQVRGKTKLANSGQEACRLVSSGASELGIAQTTTARATPGVESAGTLPKELGVDIVVSVGIVVETHQQEASLQLVKFLTSATVVSIIRERGMEP